MTMEEIRQHSLSITEDIRRAEAKGDMEEVMSLLREKQPLASMLYLHGLAKEAGHAKAV